MNSIEKDEMFERIVAMARSGNAVHHAAILDGLNELASAGYAKADDLLGTVYYHEQAGVNRDFRKAMSHYRAAAERGIAQSQYALAYMLGAGEGCETDPEEAEEWAQRAADQGYSNALFAMSTIECGRNEFNRALMYHLRGCIAEKAESGVVVPEVQRELRLSVEDSEQSRLLETALKDKENGPWILEQIGKWERSLPENVRKHLPKLK